jgi:2',3'-cyclic-nucleotide 2'-phosphodiesterase (5'-nucleotidase family)
MTMKTLTILEINDAHGYLELHPEIYWEGSRAVYRPAGGYARIARIANTVREERPGRVLFLDGGDTLHGTFLPVQTQGQALVPILNRLGIDAMTGHWDFAYGPAALRARVGELAYPLLAGNVYDRSSGERPFPPFTVTEAGGLRVGVIGIASNIVDKTMPPAFSEGIRFTLGRDELPALIEHLRERERVDLVVLLSHLGFPQDIQLLAEVEGIDVCLSSHTHNRLEHPALQGRTVVIQSGAHGSFLGRLDLTVEQRQVIDVRHELIDVEAAIEPDPEVDALVREALAPHRSNLETVVGETATPLHRATSLASTMDSLLLHALLDHTGAQLAFSNGWRYGAPIVPGPVTLNDLYNIIPMNPPVSMVELRGEELLAMLEENLERTFSRNPFEQMGGYVKRAAGLTAYVKLENPAGYRLQKLFVGDDEVEPERTYSAAFVTAQGVGPEYGQNRRNFDTRAVDALSRYLARRSPVVVSQEPAFVVV